MARHIATGVEAVVDGVSSTTANRIVVEPEATTEALEQIGKLTGDDFPHVEAWVQVDGTGRVHLNL